MMVKIQFVRFRWGDGWHTKFHLQILFTIFPQFLFQISWDIGCTSRNFSGRVILSGRLGTWGVTGNRDRFAQRLAFIWVWYLVIGFPEISLLHRYNIGDQYFTKMIKDGSNNIKFNKSLKNWMLCQLFSIFIAGSDQHYLVLTLISILFC